jgi:Rab5 GDP/GTP exchange factor
MVHEQVKIISDFLEFISKKMAMCEVWLSVSDAEFDNACEGMEKLVMNRLYSQTFSPAIPPPDPALGRSKRRTGHVPPGRRGQHQEDVERDEILAQKVRIYSWVREDHLDIKPLSEKGKKFLILAQQGLAAP